MANQAALARLAATKAKACRRRVEAAASMHAEHMRQVARDARIETIDAYHARRNGVVY